MPEEDEINKLQISLLKWQKRFFQIAFAVLVTIMIVFIFWLGSYFHDVTNVIGFSILISYLLIGAVDWIQFRLKIKKRRLAVLVVYSFILLFSVLFCLFVIPSLFKQIQMLAAQLPHYIENIKDWLYSLNLKISNSDFPYTLNIELLSKELTQSISTVSQTAFNQVFKLAFNTINFAILSLATVVLSVYMLIDGPKIWDGLMRPLPQNFLVHANHLRNDLSRCLRGYFIGQIQLSSLSGVYVFFVYIILGSKYALLLGIWQALVEVIPVIGGFLGIGLGILVMLFDPHPLFGNPLWKPLIATIAYFGYTQIVKDNFLTPRIMSNSIGLHPVMVILVVFLGAKIGGITGVVFALPIAGLLNVVFDYFIKLRNQNKL
jgi:predicted PurR-regulated permease PerM